MTATTPNDQRCDLLVVGSGAGALSAAVTAAHLGLKVIVVEKDPPHTVSLYYPPPEDIERGRNMMRQAINVFAACLKRNEWPGYAPVPMEVGLPIYARMRIDESTETDLAKAIWGEPEGEAA